MMTVTQAYELACREVEAQTPVSPAKAGTFVDDWNQVRPIPNSTPFEHMPPEQRPQAETVTPSPGLGGEPCLIHREKVHTFADGTTLKACAHTFCGWGKSTKRHSDGVKSGTVYSAEIDTVDGDDEDVSSPDEPQELGLTVTVRGDDIDDDSDDETLRVERAADEAATEGSDEEEADDITDED